MNEKSPCFVSNSMSVLLDLLKHQLSFETTHLTLVHSPLLKEPLLAHVKEKEGSAMMIKGVIEGLCFLFERWTGRELRLPSLPYLTLHLESLLSSLPPKREMDTSCAHTQQADALAKTFLNRVASSFSSIQKWLTGEGEEQRVWKIAFDFWDLPHDLQVPFPSPPKGGLHLHLFNLPFIPHPFQQFLHSISSLIPVYYYQFSPCREFWTDTLSEGEASFLLEKDPSCLPYLEHHHPLLGDFGTLLRHRFLVLDELDLPLRERYVDPPHTLLGVIQQDILHDRLPVNHAIQPDGSLLLHPCPSKLREVERLHAHLSSSAISPSEVQILAPNIEEYLPYISFVFETKDPLYSFHLDDRSPLNQSPFLSLLLRFFSLSEQDFSVEEIFGFLSHSFVHQKFHLTPREVENLRFRIHSLGVTWGMNRAHREQLYPLPSSTYDESGTWEQAFYILFSQHKTPSSTAWGKVRHLSPPERKSVDSLFSLMRKLKKDCDLLHLPKTFVGWALFLDHLVETYFLLPEEELPYLHFFHQTLTSLKELERVTVSPISYAGIKRFLLQTLQKRVGAPERTHPPAPPHYSFRSLQLGNILSSSMICLLGMQEGSVPSSSHDGNRSQDIFAPAPRAEEDALFLELIMSAQHSLYISYLDTQENGIDPLSPLSPIQKLLSYLATYHHIEESTLSPPSPPSISSIPSPPSPTPLFSEYLAPEQLKSLLSDEREWPLSGGEELPLSSLSQCAKHPIRFYFQHILNIFLPYPAEENPFALSSLNRFLMEKALLTTPLEEVVQTAYDYGQLPKGVGEEAALVALEEEKSQCEAHLRDFGVDKLFSLPFSFPLSLSKTQRITLTGRLDHLSPQGLVFMGKQKDILKIWPDFLLFACLEGWEDMDKKLLFAKTGKTFSLDHPKQALIDFILYYSKAIQTPSPFLPLWGDCFLNKTVSAFEKAVEHQLKRERDPYLYLAFSHYDASTIFNHWAPYLRRAFSPLLD